MGETPPRVLPIPADLKAKIDVVAVPSSVLGWLSSIPWSDLAAFLAVVYTALRIIELLWGWIFRSQHEGEGK